MTEKYYMPEPIEPSRDWVGRLMTISLWVFAAGIAINSLFALAADDIYVIPRAVQSWLVIVGSGLIVIGAELNTPPTVVAVMRKVGRREAHWLDWLIGAISLIGAMVGLWMVFARRQELNSATGWRVFVRDYGPIVIGLTMVADYYGCASELGLLRSQYDAEMREWLEDKRKWEESHASVSEDDPTVSGDGRVVGVADFRRLVSSLNGNRSALSKETLAAHFAGMRLPADSTIDRWWREELN